MLLGNIKCCIQYSYKIFIQDYCIHILYQVIFQYMYVTALFFLPFLYVIDFPRHIYIYIYIWETGKAAVGYNKQQHQHKSIILKLQRLQFQYCFYHINKFVKSSHQNIPVNVLMIFCFLSEQEENQKFNLHPYFSLQ